MNEIIRVNLRTGKFEREEASEELQRIGGRHFIAYVLNQEVEPTCEALGRHNKLIVSQGLFFDTNISTTGKISLGGKSPLTGGVKESNTGGYFGNRLTRLGIKALIMEDIPESNTTLHVLYIDSSCVKLIDVPELKFKYVSETIEVLREKFGTNIGILCIGPAGERLMYSAGIACPDNLGVQIRYAGRGGLGAVMGSKGIKAIVVKADKLVKPEFANLDEVKEIRKEIADLLEADPKSNNRKAYGTLDIYEMANQIGLLPTRNFSSGSFEDAGNFTGPVFCDLVAKRAGVGRSGTPCVPGCTIQCSNVFPDKDGKKIVASFQYESAVLLGSNLGIGDANIVGELNHLCNEVGIDTMECGVAIGIAMDSGVADFGDGEAAKEMIIEVGEGAFLGRIIGNGAKFTGQAFGNRRIPVIKGQAIPAYDPRALKGNGVLYATSPMGADHTAGNAFETIKFNNPLGLENQVSNSRHLQIRGALLDTMGVCIFIRPAFVKDPNIIVRLFKAKFGCDLTFTEIREIGANILDQERSFNEKAGVSERFQLIPEFMREEPLPPNNEVFDISQKEMEEIWNIPIRNDSF